MGTISSILDISRRSLNTQSQAIRTLSDNISNVNTPGYSRRNALIVSTQATGAGNILTGSGVEIERVVRRVDEFLNREYLTRISDRAGSDIRQQYLDRAEQPFALESTAGHIGYELSNFFSSLEDLANSPSDLPLRTQVLQSGQSLVASIKDAYNNTANLQREANTRIGDLVTQVNTLSAQIAEINAQIKTGETPAQENLTLRDRRDQLLRDLSEIVPVQTLETSDHQVLVSLSNGFALVKGSDYQQLDFTTSPSFAPGAGYPTGLDGAALGFVVYDFDQTATTSHADFTTLLAAQGGELGALLRLRGVQSTSDTSTFDAVGDLVDIGARIESISRDLLTRFNRTYLGSVDETPGGAFNPSSGGLDDIGAVYSATPVYGLFSFTGITGTGDLNADGLPNDLTASGQPANFSSRLTFNVTDERTLAHAQDLDSTSGVLSFAPGDATNIHALANLRTATTNYSLGHFSANSITIEQLYGQTVGFVGGINSAAKSNYDVYKDREAQVKELYASTSGVNLDEEFANLVNFQRGFEAAARMVKVADDLFQNVIALLQ